MSELETAEEFAERLDEHWVGVQGGVKLKRSRALRLIEADRNAVRNALLDEMLMLDDDLTDTMPFYRAVAILRRKYNQKPEVTDE